MLTETLPPRATPPKLKSTTARKLAVLYEQLNAPVRGVRERDGREDQDRARQRRVPGKAIPAKSAKQWLKRGAELLKTANALPK